MATLKDIAEITGTDKASVSRVLQGRAREYYISREREKRIKEAARKLGYRPNAAARAIRTGRFQSVSLLIGPEKRNWLPEPLLEGILHGLQEASMTLNINLWPKDKPGEASLPRPLEEEMSDGILVALKSEESVEVRDRIRQMDTPVIWLTHELSANCIRENWIGGGRRAAEYLLDLGHRRIAYVGRSWPGGVHPDDPTKGDKRYDGYAEAMEEAGLEPQKLTWQTVAERRSNIRESLSGEERITAIICHYHELTEEVFLAALKLGLRVPQDLSVLEFHTIGLEDYHPMITAVTVNEYAKGLKAVELLQKRIENPGQDLEPHVMHMELTQRNTCARLE